MVHARSGVFYVGCELHYFTVQTVFLVQCTVLRSTVLYSKKKAIANKYSTALGPSSRAAVGVKSNSNQINQIDD